MPKNNTTARKAPDKAKTVRERAQAIIADRHYDVDTRDAIRNPLQDDQPDSAELVRYAERGGIILDLAAPPAAAPPRTLAELAALISAAPNHPLLPESVYDDLWEAVNQPDTPTAYYSSASYIEGRLRGVVGPVVGPQKA